MAVITITTKTKGSLQKNGNRFLMIISSFQYIGFNHFLIFTLTISILHWVLFVNLFCFAFIL